MTEETLQLNPADRLILYTDGLIDTVSPDGVRFDRSRLHNLLKDIGYMSANKLCDAIFDVVCNYQGAAEQFDDMTLLVMAVDSPIPFPSSD